MDVEVSNNDVLRAPSIFEVILSFLDDNSIVMARNIDSLDEEVVNTCVDSIGVETKHWDLVAQNVLPWIDTDLEVMKVRITRVKNLEVGVWGVLQLDSAPLEPIHLMDFDQSWPIV